MTKFKDLIFHQSQYEDKSLAYNLGTVWSKHTFNNGITISIIADSLYASPVEGLYEVAFYRGNCPIDIPKPIKDKFKSKVLYDFILTYIPEKKVSWILQQLEQITTV